jgi:hypothetical protein
MSPTPPSLLHRFIALGDGMVEIHLPTHESFRMHESQLKVVVENIRLSRNHYATEEAYFAALNLYEGALAFVQGKSQGEPRE